MITSLLRNELWNSTLLIDKLSKSEYSDIIGQAESQTVLGLICDALISNNVRLNQEDAYNTYGQLVSIQYQNSEVNKELINFVRELENEGIEYVVVKGQTMAAHYPNPTVRMAGDVDVYLPGENYDKAKSYIEKQTGEELAKYSDGKHVEFARNDVIFELHDKLSQFSTQSHQAYFDQMMDEVIRKSNGSIMIDGCPVKTLPPTYNILYTFIHLFFHLTAQGIGLRQFCDLAVLIGRTPVEEVNKAELEERLEALDLTKAFRAVGAVLVDHLGLPSEQFPLQITEKDHRWSEVILKNVMKRGNFGRNIRKVDDPGFLHSLESGFLVVKQAFVFFQLAPAEVFGRFFSIGNWFFKRWFKNRNHLNQ